MVPKIKALATDQDLLKRLDKVRNKRSRLLVHSGADPWVIFKDGWYYYCRVIDDWQILVNKARRLQDIGKSNHVIWQHPLGNHTAEVWAPELHFLQGKWYVYFTMGAGAAHRMYVLEAKSDDPQGEYRLKGQITDPADKWAIDGTVLELEQKLYFIWSGWEGDTDVCQNLYIAPMINPWTISGKRVCIATPEYAWERATKPGLCDVNEGPQVLKHGAGVFIIYSASHSLTNDYCLGQLSLNGNNPLSPRSWHKKPMPVFAGTDLTFGPGHASFTKSRDGSDWIIYHSARHSDAGWDRQVHAQRFHWSEKGEPTFHQPLPIRQALSYKLLLHRLPGFRPIDKTV